MRRLAIINTLLAAILALSACHRSGGYYEARGYAQGGEYRVVFNSDGCTLPPERVSEGIDSVLTAIDNSLSGYNKGSLLSAFNRGETITPDELFLECYELSYKFFEQSEGALDVAAGPVFDAWGFGFTGDSLPSDEALEELRLRCGMHRLRPDIRSAVSPDGTLSPASLLREGEDTSALPVLNFNAIAQGYSSDVVARHLKGLGIKDMLVDIGEIWCDGLSDKGRPWRVGVDRPVDGNNSPGQDIAAIWQSSGGPQGLVTSGNYRKFYIKNGRKYGHTIDPRTARPAENSLLSATIVAPDAATADAVATWCMVLGPDPSIDLITSTPELEALLIYDSPTGMTSWSSPGFNLVQ